MVAHEQRDSRDLVIAETQTGQQGRGHLRADSGMVMEGVLAGDDGVRGRLADIVEQRGEARDQVGRDSRDGVRGVIEDVVDVEPAPT